MTDTNPPTPPTPPPQPPQPPQTPPTPAPTTWPAAPANTPWPAPPSPWGQPSPLGYAPRKTNGLAITALILAAVAFVFWPLALFLGIAAVITGHIARGQIRRANGQGVPEQGSGLALAGLILGYIWIALSILGAIALVLILTLAVPATTQVSVRHDARRFGNDTVLEAISTNKTPRDPAVVQEVYRQRYVSFNESENKHARLPDGTSLFFVTAGALAENQYRVEFSEKSIGTKYACLTLPERGGPVEVVDGRC